ncbi:MAG: hypothetical protein Q4C73_08830 [Eubacteriales bacterium]|nr:hypothetical protein [Eubacteriales bacterium]
MMKWVQKPGKDDFAPVNILLQILYYNAWNCARKKSRKSVKFKIQIQKDFREELRKAAVIRMKDALSGTAVFQSVVWSGVVKRLAKTASIC